MRLPWSQRTQLLGLLSLALFGSLGEVMADGPQALIYAEYFWDSDPGLSNGIPVSVAAAESLTFGNPGSQALNVSTTNLSAGPHRLGFRVVDASARPSDVNWLPIQVQNAATLSSSVVPATISDANKRLVAAECFWDNDPGFGNGTPVSVATNQSFTLGAPGSNLFSADTTALGAGPHRLGFRSKDATGNWSAINWLPVQVQNAATLSASLVNSKIGDADKALVGAEYFWDTDPGFGSGTPVSAPAGQSFTFGAPGTNLFGVDQSQLAAGVHRLGVRARDASTNWSDINWLTVEVRGTPWVLLNGQFYSNNVVVTTNGASFQVTMHSRFVNSNIFYTTDGSDPSAGDTYSGLFNVTAPFLIRAVAYDEFLTPPGAEADPVVSLSVTNGGGGNVAVQVDSTNAVPTATLTANPLPGWTLMSWTGDGSGTNTTVGLTMNGPKSVGAIFGTSLTTSGSGQVLRQPDLPLYPYGSTVRLTAVPTNSITYFRQWSGAASGQFVNPLNFVITGATQTVSAVFFALPGTTHSLTVLISGEGNVTKSPQQSNYTHNGSVTLTATPQSGSTFVNWSGDTNSVLNPLAVLMNTNKIITATFQPSTGPSNAAPAVTITNPVDGITLVAPVDVSIQGAASDSDGTVSQVQLRSGTNALATLTNAAFSYTWTNAPVGTNILTAVATDNGGLSTSSGPVSVIVQTATPQIVLTSPTNGASYSSSANILLSALASDADNSISNVTFYAGTNLLATLPAQPYNFTWSNVTAGSYTLSARVQDIYGPMVTSTPVSITVVAPNIPARFRLANGSQSVAEDAGTVAVMVVNDGTMGGTVNYACADVTATGGSGSSGDYTRIQGSLSFTNGEASKTLIITIRDDLLPEANEAFDFQLSNPGGGATLTNPATARITIVDNDASYATNSWLAIAFPSAVPDTSGKLRVTLTPPEAGGQWRFPWELGWRNSGALVTNLVPDNYDVELRPVAGYAAIPSTVQVAVAPNVITEFTNQYFNTGPGGVGYLTVNLQPNTVASNAGWRIVGEVSYRPTGSTATNLVPGIQVIEFQPVSGWSAPAKRAVQVYADQGSVVTGSYLLADPLPGGAQLPQVITPFTTINDSLNFNPLLPYAFNGQLQTSHGFGSGVAVRDRVVLTAAHVVFDDETLSFVNEVNWFFQKHAGDFDPRPQKARGWYVLSSYSAARSNDLASGYYAPGQSSPQSRTWDVAALYFNTPATRGGYGGYLTSDAATNEWLVSSRQKLLVGYPLDGAAFGYAGLSPGKMHTTAALNYSFTAQSNRVYTTSGFLSFPGNSGGPVYVLNSNAYFPAGVYLGTLGNNLSLVRSIDSNVVALINFAANLGDDGTNNTGGGVLTIIPSQTGGGGVGYLQVHVGPTNALQAGGGWRLVGDAAYSSNPGFTRVITNGGGFSIEFAPAFGWNLPPSRSVTVPIGQLTVIDANYTVLPPLLALIRQSGLGVTGTTGTTYRLEFRTNLTSGAWLPLRTNTLDAGFNLFLPWPPTNGPAAFYRAVWLP